MKFPTLYHQQKNGKIRQWTIWTEGGTVKTEYGEIDGTMQYAEYEAEGKNLGKTNETLPCDQAVKEAQAKWKKRKDTTYSISIAEAKYPDTQAEGGVGGVGGISFRQN